MIVPPRKSAAASLPDERADESCIRRDTREPRRAQKSSQRRMPSFSINAL
jgi:hypothetical protein